MTVLIILESNAKCATISRILGDGVKCVATGGHIREVEGGLESLSDNYIPLYKIKNKGLVRRLREAVRNAESVLLAMDDDREGEAIAWHCCQCLGLPPSTKRMVFHAVTPECIRNAYSNTRPISMNLVRAQIARVSADLLVGFTVSPELWNAIGGRGRLSAGRCQTPALGLTIAAADEGEDIKVQHRIVATFQDIPTDFIVEPSFLNSAEVAGFFEESASHAHLLTIGESRPSIIRPPRPLTTSGLQQLASSRLGWNPKKTMSEAGNLYNAGHITYPRTDKAEYSEDFVTEAEAFIRSSYGADYLPNSSTKPSKAKHAQEAHEAIRVTRLKTKDVDKSPLYRIIWLNTVQSCMNECSRLVNNLSINAPCGRTYVASLVKTLHLGWRAADNHTEFLDKENALRTAIEDAKKRDVQDLSHAQSHVAASGGGQLLKEASLIKALERTGIGRPSTYASLVEKLLDREYVQKADTKGIHVATEEYTYTPSKVTKKNVAKVIGSQKQRLIPTDLGREVYATCMQLHNDLFSISYTADLETQLDAIANGTQTREIVCSKLVKQLSASTSVESLGTGGKGYSYCVGKYGPCLREDTADGKVVFHKLRKGVTRSMVNDTKDPSSLIHSDVHIGMHENNEIVLKTGKYGEYIQHGSSRVSWNKPSVPDLETAIELLRTCSSSCLRILNKEWKILRGVNGRPNYAQKNCTGLPKLARRSLERYPGNYMTDPPSTVLQWINNANNV